ncbi:MAG: hypothetical protein JNM29_08625, partial [Candidatus Odyssella sp.]|nr:hypothetical protein [Candidatus Odyssella sp.]
KLAARMFDTSRGEREADSPYRVFSYWVALGRSEARLAALTEAFDAKTPSKWGTWRALKPRPGFRVWTDDYSNIVTLMQ